MAIILRLDRIMADRKMSLKELAENVGISYVNLSKIKTGKVQGIRFSTLEAICETLECQPGDILEFAPGDGDGKGHREHGEERTTDVRASPQRYKNEDLRAVLASELNLFSIPLKERNRVLHQVLENGI